MTMSRRLLAALASVVVLCSATARAEPSSITLLTGNTSGIYFPLGVSIAMIYADIPGAKVQVQTTDGSVENLSRLQQGTGQVAFALGDALKDAWAGNATAGFDGKQDRLRVIGALYPNYIQIVATRESGIRTLSDLRGKSLSAGDRRSGTELNARTILRAVGQPVEVLGEVRYVSFAESTTLMIEKKLDAAVQSAGLGVTSIKELSEATDITLVPLPRSLVRKMGAPFKPDIIPAKTYVSQNKPVPTASVMNYLVTSTAVPDDLVYEMTKRLFDGLDELAIAHRAGHEIRLARAVGKSPVPLHPGALRYYREKGLIK